MISRQPSPISESVQLSPPQSSSSPPISLAVSDSPAPDSTTAYKDAIIYTTLQQNCLAVSYGHQPPLTSIDTPSDITTAIKYKHATVISPPHQQHVTTLLFSQPFSPISPSSAVSSPHSCSGVVTSSTSHQNHLYKQHQDRRSELPRQYSAQGPRLNFPENREQFYERDAIDTNNIESPHHTHSNSARYHQHCELVQDFQDLPSFSIITDINNNDDINNSCRHSPGFTEPSTVCDYSLDTSRFRFTGGRVSPVDIDRNSGKLPPISALWSNSAGKPGTPNSIMMKLQESVYDESDDSGVSSLEEESHYTNLTNVPPTPHDNGNYYDYDTHELSYGDWSMGEHIIPKSEPNNLFFDFINIGEDISFADKGDVFNMDSPTQDSDEYESGGADSVPLSHCFQFTNTEVYRPATDVSNRLYYHEHERFLSSDSEEPVLEDTLPNFKEISEIQNHAESDKLSQYMRSTLLSPKKKRKAVRESPSYVEKERRKPGRKPGQVSNVLHLWEFMRDLLHSSENQGIIEWISKPEGVFRVMNSTEVARLWGEKKKNKKKMTYEKLSRSLRYSRLEGYFADLPRDKNYPKKLCFKFGPKSKDWH